MAHRPRVLTGAVTALLASLVPASAHHGSSISYFTDRTMTLTGTVQEWDMINPHPQIYFDVKGDKGQTEHWAAELLPTPLMLKNMKVGWSRDTLKPGDTIVLTCNPPRSEGAKACLAKGLLVNGRDWPLGAGPGGPAGPAGTVPGATKGKQ